MAVTVMKEDVYTDSSLETGTACEAPTKVSQEAEGARKGGMSLDCGFQGKEQARQGKQAEDWLVGITLVDSGVWGCAVPTAWYLALGGFKQVKSWLVCI